jgi:serine/threonine protein phosphatase PrpC
MNVVVGAWNKDAPKDALQYNEGPFSVFAIIDGHRGDAVAKFLHKHLIDCILRNKAMMVDHHFSTGLK